MTGSSFPPPPPAAPLPPPTGPIPATEGDKSSASWWKRKTWILPVWVWILVGFFGVGATSSAIDKTDGEARDNSAAAVTTEASLVAEATEAVTTTTEATPTPSEPDDSVDVSLWTMYAAEAFEVSGGVVATIGDIATDASSDSVGWTTGDYAGAAIDAWSEATLMLDEWNKRPQPVPGRVAQCDALADQMFVATLDVADVFSDMAIEGSTDPDLLSQLGADLGAINDMAEENPACRNGF